MYYHVNGTGTMEEGALLIGVNLVVKLLVVLPPGRI
jgi:hypothetical protein